MTKLDVDIFAGDGGLVIGTEQLLRIVLMFDSGDMSADEARQLLWSSFGYLELGGPAS